MNYVTRFFTLLPTVTVFSTKALVVAKPLTPRYYVIYERPHKMRQG